ncbi:Stf0 family sulfotransferase [Chachezhania antarctica]|uniref:Stf0 family sulfotransferase n=1 Tax=Chachezhania antarctica TaxID=2340860 RepID=UPI000EB39283|nr:Stf0 family sulfotransferase [Chachezhania antarctica]|tara:strand:- start:1541 stop:2314 length:774 start_codon:yes stop_codon:yes gene_type:complete
MSDYDGYVLCGTPRTGSTLLCDMLASMGTAGSPDSYFQNTFSRYWLKAWDLPERAFVPGDVFDRLYLDHVLAEGRAGTPVFALRLMRADVEGLTGMLGRLHPGLPDDRARLKAAFGRLAYIHLSRQDTLAQAVSYLRARQTGLWHKAPDGSEIERLAPQEPEGYDYHRIAAQLAEFETLAAAWDPWFDAQGITPLRIAYEDLAEDPPGALARIAAKLGLPAPKNVQVGVARLSDATSADWIARFRRDRAARTVSGSA